MTDIDQRIRDAYRPTELDPDTLERGWDELALERATPATPSRRRRASARAPRVLVAIAVLVVSASSLAIAQTDTIQDFISSDDRSKAADRMEVFDEPAIGLQGLPESAKYLFREVPGDPEGLFRNPIDPGELRSALTFNNERIRFDLRSAPAEDGRACHYFTLATRRGNGPMREHSGGSGCSLAMRYNGHVTVGVMGDIRMGRLVFGLADDAVRQVRVRLSNRRIVPAHMGRNGFALHLANPQLQTRGLLVDLDDGTTLDVAMNGCLREQVVPPPKSRLGCGYGMGRGPESPPR